MIIRRLHTGDEGILEEFLSIYSETSMFMRSNLRNAGLEYHNQIYQGEYLGSFDDNNNIDGVIVHYWNGNIMMQTIDINILSRLIFAFYDIVSRPISGILGTNDQAEFVIQKLQLSNDKFAINKKDKLYSIDLNNLVNQTILNSDYYAIVEANKVGIDLLYEWIKAYEIEALGSNKDIYLDKKVKVRINSLIKGADCWVLLFDNQPVSLIGFNARLEDIVQIGPVWTPPEYRSRGHARLALRLALEKARNQGIKKAILFTDNPAAIKAYESIGFKKIGFYRLALLKNKLDLSFNT